jgi:hypothetical protein
MEWEIHRTTGTEVIAHCKRLDQQKIQYQIKCLYNPHSPLPKLEKYAKLNKIKKQ